MSARFSIAAALGACLAAAGCDFDKQLEECAKAELCVLPAADAPRPTLRFPHNGFGLGSESAVTTQLAWGPKRPYLTWEFAGDDSWNFRVQLHKCPPGQSLAQCPFPTTVSSHNPDTPATTYQWEEDLEIGNRYWWRVRACTTAALGHPCGPWSDPRYFDVGRPEALPNDMAGNGLGELAVAQADPLNAGTSDKVYLYLGNNTTGPIPWTGRPTLEVGPPAAISTSYTAIPAGAGDLNGDGFSDLAVGYRLAGGASTQLLPVHLYLSSAAGPGASVIELGPYADSFGVALGRAGDVNGDGASDLAVCQPGSKRALIYFGRSLGPANVSNGDAQLVLATATSAGCAFAALADVDADGNDDIAVSAPGQLRIFHGHPGAGAWDDAFDVSIPANAGFGASMAGGDFNGDGHGDLVVEGNDGKAYLYLGSPQWFSGVSSPQAVSFGIEPGMIVPAGDVNNDGFADLAVGGRGAGQVRLYLGQATGALIGGPTLTGSLQDFGATFAGVGDVTNDSFDDVLVGGTGGAVLFRGAALNSELGGLTNVLLPPAGSVNFGAGAASGY